MRDLSKRVLRSALVLVVAVGLWGCSSSGNPPGTDPATPTVASATPTAVAESATPPNAPTDPIAPTNPELIPVAERVTHSFTPASGNLLNPERGLFSAYDLPNDVDFSAVRDEAGNTLIRSYIRLDEWRDSDLPQSLLDELTQSFAALRAAGVKVIPRFAYNAGPYPDSEPDASLEQVLRHIEQVTPILRENADVIAWMETGFIGAWGEWHTSTNGLDQDPDAKRAIVAALLAALPPERMIQLRYPTDIIEFNPTPLSAESAFTQSDQARIGHHNDCFLASADDEGTYTRGDENTMARDQDYLHELSRFTPMGGETCNPNPPRSDCPTTLAEMELLHFSEINLEYHEEVVQAWRDQGCFEEIQQRLGYRFVLQTASYQAQVRPGGTTTLEVTFDNQGFASLINPRPLYLVVNGAERYVLPLPDVEPRRWEAGQRITLTIPIRLPAGAAEGEYQLALWLPDASDTLRDDPRYAVAFANENVWDDATGDNLLGTLTISTDAGGESDPTAEDISLAAPVTVTMNPIP
jgi:hypothetical protein